jgi:hypothetical protein
MKNLSLSSQTLSSQLHQKEEELGLFRAHDGGHRQQLSIFQEDLQAMTKENSALNEQLLIVQKEKEISEARREETILEQQRSVQALKVRKTT